MFNENRRLNIIHSGILVIDESMSAWKPKTTKTCGLPNLSCIPRKPRPIGTEFKNTADAETGVMLFWEIQEGKVPVGKKRFRDTNKATTATGMRLALGALGK